MKIAVIFTGGTIGSKLTDGWISASRETKFQLVENYKAHHKNDIEFFCTEPYYILSEKLSANELNLLLSAFKEAEDSDADGIIITHGTDSLQFSAAAISLVSKCKKPTLFVSANYPLDDPRSNGNENFAAAVDFIMQGSGNGVYVSYKNSDGILSFHRGDKIVAYLEGDDRLYSLKHSPYAVWEKDRIKVFGDSSPLLSSPMCTLTDRLHLLCITASPADGFDYSLKGINAVILRPYHSGTLNTSNPYFVSFLSQAKERHIPVFLVNAPMGETYETAKLYDELGIVSLPQTTFSSVYMRLWFACSCGENLYKIF